MLNIDRMFVYALSQSMITILKHSEKQINFFDKSINLTKLNVKLHSPSFL